MAQPNDPAASAGLPNFVVSVVHRNTQPLPADFRPRPQAPAGVPLRLPFFGSLADIVNVQIARQRRFDYPSSATLGGFAAGFVVIYALRQAGRLRKPSVEVVYRAPSNRYIRDSRWR